MVKTGRFRSSQGHLNGSLAKILESPFDILDQERTQIPGNPVPDEKKNHATRASATAGTGRVVSSSTNARQRLRARRNSRRAARSSARSRSI